MKNISIIKNGNFEIYTCNGIFECQRLLKNIFHDGILKIVNDITLLNVFKSENDDLVLGLNSPYEVLKDDFITVKRGEELTFHSIKSMYVKKDPVEKVNKFINFGVVLEDLKNSDFDGIFLLKL